MRKSAPWALAMASFSGPPAQAMTRAPSALPTSTPVSPTPPAAPSTSSSLARLQVGAPDQRAIGRAIGDGEAGGGGEIHRLGDGEDVGLARQHLLGEAAMIEQGQHPLARLDPADARARRRATRPATSKPGREGRQRPLLVFARGSSADRRN